MQAFLGGQPGVSAVHHLHIWALGSREIFLGDHRLLFDEPARLAAVTLDQANRAAASVLRRINRTVGLIRPSAAATKD